MAGFSREELGSTLLTALAFPPPPPFSSEAMLVEISLQPLLDQMLPTLRPTSLFLPCSSLSCFGYFSIEHLCIFSGCPWWLSGREPTCQCRRCRFNPWVRKIPWIRKWQPTPGVAWRIFLPGESHGQRSLMGYSPWSCKELETTEQLNNNKGIYNCVCVCVCLCLCVSVCITALPVASESLFLARDQGALDKIRQIQASLCLSPYTRAEDPRLESVTTCLCRISAPVSTD